MTQTACLDPEATGHRRTNLSKVESFPLDVAGLVNILGQSLEKSFLPEVETQSPHAACKPALCVPDSHQPVGHSAGVPPKMRPSGLLIDI